MRNVERAFWSWFILSMAQLAVAQDCSKGMKGPCSACGMCCCYRGPLRYMVDESTCTCALKFGGSFVIMMVMSVITLIFSIMGGYYFSGKSNLGWFNPYPRESSLRGEPLGPVLSSGPAT